MRVENDPALINALRTAYGRSTGLWTSDGVHDVGDERWIALSGKASIDFNLALCYADSAKPITEVLDRIKACGVPAVLMLTGPALGQAQTLTDCGWVCIGQTAFMLSPLLTPALPRQLTNHEPDARQLVLVQDERRLLAARELVAAAFKTSSEDAVIALPDQLLAAGAERLWSHYDADGELLACVCTVEVDDVAIIWSMATQPELQGTGQGRALLAALRAQFATATNTRHFLLTSSNAGYALYRDANYDTLERWQMWSRPRWVIGSR
jgi:ribosomal protein S18 acetylase RimI-like enzyme